jgi:hypothetical protein
MRLHHTANAASDQAIEKLCDELNATLPGPDTRAS